jgi:hypothetical protein
MEGFFACKTPLDVLNVAMGVEFFAGDIVGVMVGELLVLFEM